MEGEIVGSDETRFPGVDLVVRSGGVERQPLWCLVVYIHELVLQLGAGAVLDRSELGKGNVDRVIRIDSEDDFLLFPSLAFRRNSSNLTERTVRHYDLKSESRIFDAAHHTLSTLALHIESQVVGANET